MKTSKGFTLTELLIVMAIIVVLAAVAVPTFTKQLETSRETADMEIIRNAYTEALSAAVQDGADGTLDGKIGQGANAITANWGSVTGGTNGVYTVTLANMQDAKFKQSGTYTAYVAAVAADPSNNTEAVEGVAEAITSEWSYVTPQLVGKIVKPVCSEVATLIFTFTIDANGEVTIPSTSNYLFALGAKVA